MSHMTGAFEFQGYGRGTDRLIALSFSLSTLTWGLGRCGEEIVSPPDGQPLVMRLGWLVVQRQIDVVDI